MTNPITDAEVDAIDANLEPERRIQSLIHLWLKFYFSGSPFQTKGSTGASVSYTFVPCEFTYNTDALPRQTNASKPVIHIFTAFRDTKRADYTEDAVGHDDDWTILLMPKVRTGSVRADGDKDTDPDRLCRKVSDQLVWLLCSCEREALYAHGLHNVHMQGGPALANTGAWVARTMTLNVRTRRENAR